MPAFFFTDSCLRVDQRGLGAGLLGDGWYVGAVFAAQVELGGCGVGGGGDAGAHVATDFVLVTGVLAGEARECVGDDVGVVQIAEGRVAAHVQPEAVHQLHVFRAEVGRVRSDVEDLELAVGLDDVEVELALGFGERFPCLAEMVGLLFGGHLGGDAGDYGVYVERVGGLREGGEDVTGGDYEQGDGFSEALGYGDGLGEEHLLVLGEGLLVWGEEFGAAYGHDASIEYDYVLLVAGIAGEGPLEREGVGGVAHGDHDAAGTDANGSTADLVLMLELEVVLHLALGLGVFAHVGALREGEDDEERRSEDDAADGGHGLGEEIHHGRGGEHEEDRDEAEGNLGFADADVRRNLPAAFAVIFPAENEHGEGVEGEGPDDAEGICLAEHDDVSTRGEDREHLQDEDEVHDAVAGAEGLMRLAEPVGEHAVFGDAHEHAGGADHRGVDGSGENEEADDDDEDAEGDAEKLGADHEHGNAGDEVVLVNVGALICRDEHGGEQRDSAGEDERVDGDDDGRALEVLELGMLDFAVYLGERFFSAHGQDGVAEGHQDAKDAEDGNELGSLEEAECIVREVQVGGCGRRGQVNAADANGVDAPEEQNDHHDGGDLHDAQGLVAGFLDALDVLPPVINGDDGSEDGGGVIDVELEGQAVGVDERLREPAMVESDVHQLVHQADDVLSCGNA